MCHPGQCSQVNIHSSRQVHTLFYILHSPSYCFRILNGKIPADHTSTISTVFLYLLHTPLTFVLPPGQLQQVGSSKPPVQLVHSPESGMKPTQFSSQYAASRDIKSYSLQFKTSISMHGSSSNSFVKVTPFS